MRRFFPSLSCIYTHISVVFILSFSLPQETQTPHSQDRTRLQARSPLALKCIEAPKGWRTYGHALYKAALYKTPV